MKRTLPAFCYLRKRSGGRVYVYFDGAGVLLYIGVSNQFDRRDRAHAKSSHWRQFARWVRLESYPDRHLAEIAEDHMIANEVPEFNVKAQTPIWPQGKRHDWYLSKVGGLRGEFPRWAAVIQDQLLGGVDPCAAPDWWDEARIFALPYTGRPVKLKVPKRKVSPSILDTMDLRR